MKMIINPRPAVSSSPPLPAGWSYIRQPKPARAFGISILVGLGLPFIPFFLLSLESFLLPHVDINQAETVHWWIVLLVVPVSVLLHEFFHLLCHPGCGLSAQSLVLIWPRKFQLGVFFDGFMTRTRWLVMRLSPLVGLTILPTIVLFAVYPDGMDFFWQQFLVLVILINSLGAGADLVASVIVARQVGRGGEVGIWYGRACWRAAK